MPPSLASSAQQTRSAAGAGPTSREQPATPEEQPGNDGVAAKTRRSSRVPPSPHAQHFTPVRRQMQPEQLATQAIPERNPHIGSVMRPLPRALGLVSCSTRY